MRSEPLTADELRQAAIRLLSSREHSRSELRRKLMARANAPDMVEQVLDRLAHDGLQSDSRFVQEYIRSRVAKGFGPLRIRKELQERGIGPDQLSLGLEAYRIDWREQLQRTCEKRFGRGVAQDQRQQLQRARFLEYRGFSHEEVRSFLWG